MGGHSGLDGAREHDASPNEGDDLKTSTDPRPDDSRPNEVSTQRWIEDRVRQRLLAGPLPKERIGRFVVLESIGRGAMGQVHAAYDERLDRRVAIKVLLDEDLADREDRARFVREAQAMARLSHPNVVTVHEVGDSDGSIYLAMEHIRGQILSVWLRTGPDWRQVLDAFVQAGQGLAAAHAEGLVHRDFKPQNAMRTEQGQVKVLDFGLARAATDVLLQSHDHEELTSTGSYSMLTSELTQAGTLMGTPAYMAPEQFDGDVVDASSDQYSFCVALWEGLVGTRPFAAATVDEILALKRQGAPPWPAHAPAVPPKIVDALRRGLAVDPRERWPSMDALLSALAPDTRHSGRRWLGLAVVGGLGLAGAVFASGSGDHPQQCQGARGQLEGIWDDARRHEVAGALLGIDRAFAQEVSDTTTRQLDDYTNDWVAMHTDACEATAVRKDQSPQMLDLRMACLRRAADGLEATVTTLAHADQTVVSRAHELVTGLPPLSHCADTSALEAEVEPLLPEQAEAVQQGRRQLSRAKSLRLAGLYEAAHTAVTEASQTLGEVSYAPTRVELALERGEVLDALGRYDAAVSTYEEALTLALQSGQRAPAALAARRLLVAVGVNQRQAKAALLLRPLVLGVSLGDPMDEAEARNGLGALLRSEGRNEESEREHREALNLLTSVVDPEHPAVVETRNLLAKNLRARGKYAEAEAEHRAILALRQESLGPQHPLVASTHSTLASDLHYQAKHAEAASELRTALAIAHEALGPEHPEVLRMRHNLGSFLYSDEQFVEAEAELRAVVAMRTRLLGPEHPDVASSQTNLASVLSVLDKDDEAERLYLSILAKQQEVLGPDHPQVTVIRNNLGRTLKSRGKFDEAEVLLRQALAGFEASMGPHHPDTTRGRANLTELLLAAGRTEEALSLAEHSWSAALRGETPWLVRGWSARLLATALWDIEGPRRDRTRARAITRDVLQSARESGNHEPISDLEQWLEDHPQP